MSQNVTGKGMQLEVVETPPVGPVTALHFIDQYLISGVGSYCHLYELNTWRRLTSQKIFASSSIHGIRPDVVQKSGSVCFFGGKSLRVVAFNGNPDFNQSAAMSHCWNEVHLDDWIWDCAWIRRQDEGIDAVIAAVLGHNSVVEVDFKSGSTLECVSCQESCILYSARLIGQTWRDLMVAVGTVFNQVVLWSVNGPVNELGQVEVMHVLEGHQGVVMGVEYDSRRRQICSVSDDRSIRVWQVAFPSSSSSDGKNNGADVMNTDDWRLAEFCPIHVLYGHAARVWDAKVLADGYVSVGEDATCCLWDSSGQVTQKFKGHQGKSIWSLAVSADEGLLATGGGDSSIRVWHRTSANRLSENVSMADITMPEILQDGDFPRVVKLLNSATILVMTNKGRLLRHDVSAGKWTVVMDDVSYASYSVIAPDPRTSTVAIGNISGWLRLLACQSQGVLVECLEQRIYGGKVLSIVWLTGATDCFLTSGPAGQMFVWRVCATKQSGKRSLIRLSELVLPSGKQRWVTSACLVLHGAMLACGDREGGVHVYRGSKLNAISFDMEPCQTFSRVHGSSEVSELSYHGGQVYTCGRDGHYRVFAVTTDQRLQPLHSCRVLKGLDWLSQLIFHPQDILALGFHSNQFVAYSTSTNQCLFAVPCGGGHRAWDFVMSGDGCFLVYIKQRGIAFYRTEMTSYQDILSPSLHGREATSIRHLVSQSDESGIEHFLATVGEDGRLILLSISESKGEEFPTGSICPTTRVVASTQVPASSLRAIGISRQPSGGGDPSAVVARVLRQLVVFSGGSKGQLIAWRLHLTNSTPPMDDIVKRCGSSAKSRHGVVTSDDDSTTPWDESTTPGDDFTTPGDDFTTLGDDFVTSSDGFWELLASHSLCLKGRRRQKPWKEDLYSAEVETRYMDVCAFSLAHLGDHLPSHLHVVVAVCSSGVLRVFIFDEKCRIFHLVASSPCQGHCLLKVGHFFHRSKTDGAEQTSAYVLSAGTDGRIALWDISDIVLTFCKNRFTMDKASSDIVSPVSEAGVDVNNASDHGNVSGNVKCISNNVSGDVVSDARKHIVGGDVVSDVRNDIVGGKFDSLDRTAPANDKTASSDNPNCQSSDRMLSFDKTSSVDIKGVSSKASRTSHLPTKLVKSDSIDSISGNLSGENSSSEASYSLSSEEEEVEEEGGRSWNGSVGDLGEPVAVLEVHQSGINALDVKQIDVDRCLYAVMSGGDDGALHFHVLDLSDGATVRSVCHDVIASAHAAQITGIRFLDETTLVSASIDQRLTFWSFQDDQSVIKLKSLQSVYTDVADVSELEIWNVNNLRSCRGFRLAVSGIGLQCFRAQL